MVALRDSSLGLVSQVPLDDMEEFARLPQLVRDEVSSWLSALSQVRPPLEASWAQVARRLGSKLPTVRTKYYALKKKQDWRVLIDTRRCPERWAGEAGGLPQAFIEYWKSIQGEFQRDTSGRAARRELLKRWADGDSIPGYPDGAKEDPMSGHPRGWSEKNLFVEKYLLTGYEKKAVRIGRNAATQLLPKVLSTRVGLEFGEVVMFDDQDYDQQVNFLGVNRKLTRPSGFNALETLSGCDILRGYKPTIIHADGTKEKLRQVDFEWFVVNYLTTVGYRDDALGTLFIWEKGTTKTGAAFLERMIAATGGKVRVASGGLHNQAAFAGLFGGQPRGNPRFKAARESLFRLAREEMCALPGQTGRNRENAPEGNYGLEIENRRLIDAMAALPAGRVANMRLPVQNWHEFVESADYIWEHHINRRVWHELEGWERLGFLRHEWRQSPQSLEWHSSNGLNQMPDVTREAFLSLLQSTPGLWRTRKLSPREVCDSRLSELRKVAGFAVPVLLGPELSRLARVTPDRHFVIEDGEIDPEPMWFLARSAEGRMFEAEKTFRVYLNPFCPDRLEVCDDALRWLGTVPRWERSLKTDTDALRRTFGMVKKIEAELLQPLARRGAAITRKRTEDARYNIENVLREPASKDERSKIKRQRATAFSSDDFTAPAVPEPTTANPAPKQETPAVGSGEGFWSDADQPETNSPAQSFTFSASDFI